MVQGERVVLAEALAEGFAERAGIEKWRLISKILGGELSGTLTHHPLFEAGYPIEAPLFGGDFVSTEQGTGFVHIAPGHGADDFELGRRHGLEVPETVSDSGSFLPEIPLFGGAHVY